ncbi:lysophospholipid acyltransferase family protein [Pseudoxanthomonas dokdonensis]|uniref:Acyltransferase n=1 Tax=Pseudoxanthomonas dokdonensis TaxID=344882 RepID=A0A0R0D3L7_9GAMM|nr:lysophospholipid acyltransferase family protein [Pseudoxanthomonas dokdonensis]KRG71928.1 acyltransferase [Pseudoxanthomonas dokdonensis]
MSDERRIVPPGPPNMPRVKPNRFTRWAAQQVLKRAGWRIVGELPNVPKLVMIVAPHSSNWDGFWGMAVKIAIGFEVRVLGKAQLFWWPLSPLLRRLGVVPVDRSSPKGVVEQAIERIRQADKMWFAVTPEGTRKAVKQWKTGFWKIAKGADVPILMAYFHYPEKTVGIGELFYPSDDMAADMASIREWYRPWQGKNRGTV